MVLPSCLKSGLKDIESFSDVEIIEVKFEHRWTYLQDRPDPNAGPIEQLAVVSLSTNTTVEGNIVNCEIRVPAAGSPGFFTTEEREKVSLSKLVGLATISNGAVIAPVGDSPVFGEMGTYSNNCKYLVTAADGVTTKEYTLVCTLIK